MKGSDVSASRPHRGKGTAGRREASFMLKVRELEAVLGAIDEALRRAGLPVRAQRAEAGSDAGEVAPELDEQQAREQRAQVQALAATMVARLELRLATLARTFARLSEEERLSVAALLRLPAGRRRAIATLLELPESQRREFVIGFRLSDGECRALAELLDVTRAAPPARPKIRIVDAAVADEDVGPLPDEAR